MAYNKMLNKYAIRLKNSSINDVGGDPSSHKTLYAVGHEYQGPDSSFCVWGSRFTQQHWRFVAVEKHMISWSELNHDSPGVAGGDSSPRLSLSAVTAIWESVS